MSDERKQGSVHYREIRIVPRTRAGAIALAAGALVIGGALVVVGITLLAGLVAAGVVAAGGAAAYRALRPGRGARPWQRPLRPGDEVFPPTARPSPPAPDDARRLPGRRPSPDDRG